MRTADIIRQEIEDLERLLQGNTARKTPQVKSPGYLTGTKQSIPSYWEMYVKRMIHICQMCILLIDS